LCFHAGRTTNPLQEVERDNAGWWILSKRNGVRSIYERPFTDSWKRGYGKPTRIGRVDEGHGHRDIHTELLLWCVLRANEIFIDFGVHCYLPSAHRERVLSVVYPFHNLPIAIDHRYQGFLEFL
jgi:hypothetical protein